MYQIYQIMPGDTFDKIAVRYGSTIDNLKFINGINSSYELIPGSYIVVPKLVNDIFNSYVVKKGDDLYSIAERFNTTVDLLELVNGLKKGEYIYPNQELLIPAEDVVVYLTQNETLEEIADKIGIMPSDLSEANPGLYVVPEQLVTYKLSENE